MIVEKDFRQCTSCYCTLNNCEDFKRAAAWAVACCPSCNHPAAIDTKCPCGIQRGSDDKLIPHALNCPERK